MSVSTINARELTAPRIVAFEDLVPGWTVAPHSDEAGFFRWLLEYVGGPPGHLHEHPQSGLVGNRSIMGLMGLPVGNRQYGLHRHSTTEIYLILRGRVESIEGQGQRQLAGPLDCLYIPPGAPHCVRAIGDEDVLLLFAHDNHEPLGVSQYVTDDDPSLDLDEAHPHVVRWDALDPWWGGARAREAGHLRWSVSWVGGAVEGELNHNPSTAAHSSEVALGSTLVSAANAEVMESWPAIRYVMVARGRARVEGHPELPVMKALDVLVVPAGCPHALRPVGLDPVQLIWFHEGLGRPSQT